MGCCCSRESHSYDCESDVNDHSPLIVPINADLTDHTVLSTSPPLTSLQRNNEQDALTKILHHTATAFIDISLMEGGAVYQQDQRARAVKYSERLDGYLSSISIPASPLHLPAGLINPFPILMAPVLVSDIEMISALSNELNSYMEIIKVQPMNDLCIGF